MRPRTRPYAALLFLLSTIILFPSHTFAAEDEYEDEYEETARVVRVSMMKGEVSLRRAGNIEWERAQLNLPLVEGDVLATGRDSHVEVQIDARNFVRVGDESVLKVVTLRDEGVALSLSEGTASLRLARFDRDKEYFEIDAPGTTVAAEQRGLYRLDVASDGSVRVTVRDDGRARIYSENSGFVLRNNKTAKFVFDQKGEADWEFTEAAALDEWDFWNDERERHLAALLRFESRDRYYDREVWGAEELDSYGDWSYTREYGYLWRPHVTVINNYYNWAPYRYGHWRWCPPYGWTWIPDEQWGWAPYHYGRWVYYNNSWCWAPRGYGYHYRRAWWRPALVAFIYIPTSHGEHIAWYPLRHGQRDPRGRHWGRNRDGFSPGNRPRESATVRGFDPGVLRGVSSVPAREFGVAAVRAKPASNEIAQRALNGEPVRGRLPVTPPDLTRVVSPDGGVRTKGDTTRATGAGARPVLDITRPTPTGPPRALPQRTTGAAARTPGVPLDGELRRTRVFGNREPRVAAPNVGTVDRGDEGTGAVTRPAPGARRKPVEGAGDSRDDGGANTFPRTRPARPDTVDGSGTPDSTPAPEPRVRRPDRTDGGDGPPQPRVRPSRPAESAPADQPTFPRSEPSARRKPDYNDNPQPRREETPTYQPPPRRERPDPPRQEQPRNDPPPRQEAPRQEPKQEQPKQESPREERRAPSAPTRTKDRPDN